MPRGRPTGTLTLTLDGVREVELLNLLRRFAGRTPDGDAAPAEPAPTVEPDGIDASADAPGEDLGGEEIVVEGAEPAAPPIETIACPYCSAPLSPPPPRTRRCPSCRQQIIVRRVDGAWLHLTETEAAVLEAKRRRDADEKVWTAARQHWLTLARSVRAPQDLIRQVAEMPLTERAVDGARAVYRTAADQAVHDARRGERWAQVGRLRSIEATALYDDIGRPLPPPDDIVAMHREARAAVLHSLAVHSPVAELAGSSCCKACRADEGELCTIATELRKPRLPHPGCPRGLCECDWVLAVPEPKGARQRRRKRATPVPAMAAAEVPTGESTAADEASPAG